MTDQQLRGGDALESFLKAEGDEGWELVAVVPRPDNSLFAVLKTPGIPVDDS